METEIVVHESKSVQEKKPRMSKKAKFLKDNNFTGKVNEKLVTISATKGYSIKLDNLDEKEAVFLINKYLIK